MATTNDLKARREALAAQRSSGVARVTYDGKTVDYRSVAEIDRAAYPREAMTVYIETTQKIRDDVQAISASSTVSTAAVSEMCSAPPCPKCQDARRRPGREDRRQHGEVRQDRPLADDGELNAGH